VGAVYICQYIRCIHGAKISQNDVSETRCEVAIPLRLISYIGRGLAILICKREIVAVNELCHRERAFWPSLALVQGPKDILKQRPHVAFCSVTITELR
jgi:hypothetical protein